VFGQTRAAIACSRAFGDEVTAVVAGSTKTVVVHNGLDVERFRRPTDPPTDPISEFRDRDIILSVATFERQKGLDVLLRAFAEVHLANPRAALVLVGRTGEAISQLRAVALQLGLSNDVLFFENIPHGEIGPFFEKAKIFCLPSRSEAFGIVLLEAGAYRLPVVASRVGGIPEIIDDSETGLLVAPDDIRALAAALARLLGDGEFAQAAGRGLRRRVETEFTWTRAFDAYMSLLVNPD
jgi:glycosyltransferase involved in cell wall biosynthesis